MPLNDSRRAAIAFALLFVLYQGAELIGGRALGNFSVQAILLVGLVLVAWPIGRWLHFRGYDAYALTWRRSTPVLLVGGMALALLVKYLAVCVGMAFNVFAARAPESAPVAAVSFLSSIPWALVVTFVPSLAEDILTRGFPFRAVRVRWAPWAFVLASSLLYAFSHAHRLASGPAGWMMLLCFGMAYATAVVRTGTLWLAVGLNWGWNVANVLIGDILPFEVIEQVWSPFLWAAAHLVMFAVLFAIPTTIEHDDRHPDPA